MRCAVDGGSCWEYGMMAYEGAWSDVEEKGRAVAEQKG